MSSVSDLSSHTNLLHLYIIGIFVLYETTVMNNTPFQQTTSFGPDKKQTLRMQSWTNLHTNDLASDQLKHIKVRGGG